MAVERLALGKETSRQKKDWKRRAAQLLGQNKKSSCKKNANGDGIGGTLSPLRAPESRLVSSPTRAT